MKQIGTDNAEWDNAYAILINFHVNCLEPVDMICKCEIVDLWICTYYLRTCFGNVYELTSQISSPLSVCYYYKCYETNMNVKLNFNSI